MRRFYLPVIILAIAAVCSPASCQRLRYDSMQRGQHEFSLLTGFGANHRIPESMKDRFSFDILKIRYGWFTSPRTELYTDLTLGSLNHEQGNSAVSPSFNYRRYFAARGSTAFSYDMSFGFTHFNESISALGTRTNFTEQLGLTFFRATGRNSALCIGYTFSHTSNAGIRLPNLGVNVSMVSIGQTWYR